MSEEFNHEMLPEEEVKYAEEVIPVTRVKIIWDEYSKLGPIGKDRYLKSVQSISNFDDIKINGKEYFKYQSTHGCLIMAASNGALYKSAIIRKDQAETFYETDVEDKSLN